LSEGADQQLATFSPKGDKVAFVRANNIYVKDLVTGVEMQITKDGAFNHIINGAPDWVYEEEFSFSKAFEWNMEGTQIVYLKFNESKVKEYNMQMWGQLYPQDYRYKYPKPGEDNSVVSVHVYDLLAGTEKAMDMGIDTDIYIPRLRYVSGENVVSVMQLNRLQNTMNIIHWNPKTDELDTVYSEHNKRYVDLSNFYMAYLADGENMIITNETDGWHHLYKYNYKQRSAVQLTKGRFEVTKVVGVDEETQQLFFVSTEDGPMERQLYKVSYRDYEKKKLTSVSGIHQVHFSADYSYFIDTYSDANTPYVSVLCNAKGRKIRILKENDAIVDLMKQFELYPEL